jgi:Zn-dependent protease with chaperone function
MIRPWLIVIILMFAIPAFAGVPVTGRTQHMQFSRQSIQTIAAKAYHKELARLAKQSMLDTDKHTLERVRRISSRLIAQAILLKPAAASWPWEVHITSDPQTAANSMAGGKLLIGTHFIDRYQLADDELAVALAHEIGHVIAEHVREQVSLAASFEPRVPNRTIKVVDVINDMESDISVFFRLQPLSRLQEMEADDIGIELAAHAGVRPSAVVDFYLKLAQSDGGQSLFDTHGSSTQRVEFVESMANYARPIYEKSHKARLPIYAFLK